MRCIRDTETISEIYKTIKVCLNNKCKRKNMKGKKLEYYKVVEIGGKFVKTILLIGQNNLEKFLCWR